MSLLSRPAEARTPEAIVLPDSRKRLTRFILVPQVGVMPPELQLDWGTLDPFPDAPAGWTGLRLVGRRMDDEMVRKGQDTRPFCTLIYEQIHATNETRVGADIITHGEEGGFDIVQEWVQFSTGTYTSGTVSSTTAVGYATAFLKNEESIDDGTVRRIKRSFTTAGTIATDLQTKNNGKLLIQSITSVRTVPATPGGYTVIGQPTQHPLGLPIYTYTFAKGDGEISREVRFSQSDDGGTTGVTVTTIRHLTASGVGTDPTANPGSAVKVLEEKSDQDGYRIWTVTWSRGTGIVSETSEIKNGGKLVIYRKIELGGAPSSPSATIGGTVAATGTSVRKDSGYDIFDYTWAEGIGEISRETRYIQSDDEGVTGATIITIRHLTPLSVSENPTANPGSMALALVERSDQDGYRLWTVSYAKGVGLVLDSKEIKSGGKLVLYRRVALNEAPEVPAATAGGTVTSTGTAERKESGYDVFDYTWAEGFGEIARDIDYGQSTDQGTVGITRTTIRHLTALSVTADPTSLGGSVNIGFSFVCQDGYKLWTSIYAKGIGTITNTVYGREDGSLVYEVTALGAAAATPSSPAGGSYLVRVTNDISNGHFINRATYIKPPASQDLREHIDFPMPGLAYFVGTDLVLQPPTVQKKLATITVSYAESQATDAAFSVTTWAGFTETYTPTATGIPINAQYGLNGYLAAGATISGGPGTYKGVDVDTYSATRYASSPTSLPSGSTVLHVKNEIYLVSTGGTIVYRRSVTTATL